MITKLTFLRKETRSLTAEEVSKSIEHLQKILEEKLEAESLIQKQVDDREEARLRLVAELEENKLPVSPDLRKPITIEDVLPRRRRRRAVES